MRVIYTCDIGSTKAENFGWSRCTPESATEPMGSKDISQLVECLLKDIENKRNIALGFECPLFMPVPIYVDDLSKGRQNEGAHSMFASVGATVTILGMHQAAWILRELYVKGASEYEFTTDFSKWPPPYHINKILLCWEAFVCGSAKSRDSHVRDAATAAMYFLKNESRLADVNDDVSTKPSISLIHAVALWVGWSTDLTWLHNTVLVLKPSNPYTGFIRSCSFEEILDF